jgi:hypothetical protein
VVKPDSFEGSILEGTRERYGRFARLFGLGGDVGVRVNRVLDEEADKIQVRHGEDHLLSTMIGPLLGKAMKTFQAIDRLCLLGYGEDAAVLLRSNVNLLVNLAYIVSDPKPNDRAKEYVADAWIKYTRFMKAAFSVDVNPNDSPLPPEDLEALQKQWGKFNIAYRAKRLPEHHYKTGYKFYSGIEHSDALALFGYIADWDDVGPRIDSGPSDSHLEVVLMHNAEVMATVLDYVCKYWGITRPDIFAELSDLFRVFATDKSEPSGGGILP